jgi:bifunctional DNase/RNase
MPDLIEVFIDSVRVSLMSPQRIVILREKNAERYLPIWVGPYEAEAITVALQEVEVIRPLTHDLLKNLFTIFKALLVRVEIQSLKEEIYYGNIVAELDGHTINIDSRSSDAIALAIRAHIPIMVHPSVMEAAGIVPETDIQKQGENPPVELVSLEEKDIPQPATPEEQERLSIFDDFLDKLDKNEEQDGDDPGPSQPS